MRVFNLALAATALAGSALLAETAQAEIDAKKVADAIVARYNIYGQILTIASSETNGSNVVLKGVSYKPAVKDAKAFELGDFTLENVSEDGAGFKVGQVTVPPTTIDNNDGKFVFGGLAIKNMSIPAADEKDAVKSLLLYESLEVAPISFSMNGADVVKVDGLKATLSPYNAEQPLVFEAISGNIHGDFSQSKDPKAKETLNTLGLMTMDGTVTVKGSWNPKDGRLNLAEESFDIKNVGKLNFAIDLSGYTTDFVKQLQEVGKSAEKNNDSANGMAALGLLQQLTFNSMSIRFDDASISNKIMDYAAKQAGQPREAVMAQAKGMVPFMLMQLQDPEFATAASAALNAFLDNPKSLEIKAAPKEAVPFAILAATGMSSPAALVKQLGVSVIANQ
jgi:hypothetical protein